MSPTVAAPPPAEHNASTRPRPLQGRGLSASHRPPQRACSSPCVPAVPEPSATSRFGGRTRRCRPLLLALPNLIASAMSLTRRRHGLTRRRRRRPVTAAHDRLSSGMPRAAKERASRSWASPAAGPQPARSSPRHVDGQAACADARPVRHLSPSSTEATVAALPPQARIPASRPANSGAERCQPISARPRGASCWYACRPGRFCRLDLGSGEEDGGADVRRPRLRIRLRRRRR